AAGRPACDPLPGRTVTPHARGGRAGLAGGRACRALAAVRLMRGRPMLPPRERTPFLHEAHPTRPFPMTIRPPVPRTSRFLAARMVLPLLAAALIALPGAAGAQEGRSCRDRKSTRLNSSHVKISYAVFCL